MKQLISSYLRSWATPVVIGVFILMSVTGLLMFFHLSVGLNKLAHEWFGLLFIIGAIAHVIVHYKSFIKYFKKPLAASLISLFIVFLVLSFFSFKQQNSNPTKIVIEKIAKTPIANLVEISGKSAAEISISLAKKGFVVKDFNSDTIESLANKDKNKNREIITIIFESK